MRGTKQSPRRCLHPLFVSFRSFDLRFVSFNIQFESDIAGGGNRTLINWNFTPNYGLINGATYSEEMGGKGGGFIYPNNYLLGLFDEDDQRLENTYFRMKYYYNDPNNLPAGVSLGDEIDIYQPTGNTQSFYYQRLH